jgi:hypothetical protein
MRTMIAPSLRDFEMLLTPLTPRYHPKKQSSFLGDPGKARG